MATWPGRRSQANQTTWPDGQFTHAHGSNGFSGCAVDHAATIDEAPLPRAVLCRDGHRELTRGHNESSVNAAAYKRVKISRERGGEAAAIHNSLMMYAMSVARQRARIFCAKLSV